MAWNGFEKSQINLSKNLYELMKCCREKDYQIKGDLLGRLKSREFIRNFAMLRNPHLSLIYMYILISLHDGLASPEFMGMAPFTLTIFLRFTDHAHLNNYSLNQSTLIFILILYWLYFETDHPRQQKHRSWRFI